MSGWFLQGRHGAQGNFEAVLPATHGGGLVHVWRDNDNGMRWSGKTAFGGRAHYAGAAVIQSSYGETGNLEVLAVDAAGNLDFSWRLDHDPWTWDGPYRIATGLRGTPSLIQSRHGAQGNFEVVVPYAGGGLAHLWRDNDNGMTWNGPYPVGGQARYTGATVIQSNYGDPGNLEVLAVDEGGGLDFFWRLDHDPWTWSGPYRIASGFRGAPSLIQSRHGAQGNFEVVVPLAGGGLAHLWRDNDNGMTWNGPYPFGGQARYTSATVVQSNYGETGNLEVLAVDEGGGLDFFWRLDHDPWTWSGPFRVAAELSFPVSECTYGWTAGYAQGDTHVMVRVQLVPDAGITAATMDSLRTTWRNGITSKWSGRYDCCAPGGERRPLTFDVQWVDAGAHHVVRVRPGPARSNMGTWDTADTGDVASHEFGHMLGHPDEYADATCPARSPVSTGTVMDDNTETVARLYDRFTSFDCGHTTAAAPGEPEVPGAVPVALRSLERLTAHRRGAVLGRLRAVADPVAAVAGRDGTEVVFEVTGGAPGERFTYRLAVTGDGAAERQVRDELHGTPEHSSSRRVDPSLAARVFAAADRAGLLADTPPELQPGEPTAVAPDSLVATVTVRDGQAVRRLTVPAADPDTGSPLEAGLPLDTDVRLPRVSVETLQPVLEALSAVEAAL